MRPIHIPTDWDDDDLLTFEQFCTLIGTPQRTVRDWRQKGNGPVFVTIDGCGRLYVTVAEIRRWLGTATAARKTRPVRAVRVMATDAAS